VSNNRSYDRLFAFRIRTERNGGAWCPKNPISKNVYEWIELDLQEMKVVTQVETQGRFGNGQVTSLSSDCTVRSYIIVPVLLWTNKPVSLCVDPFFTFG